MCGLQMVGESRCPIVDTWWQTETGAAMITPLPGAWPCVPGSATLPFFGVLPVILDDKVRRIFGNRTPVLRADCAQGAPSLLKLCWLVGHPCKHAPPESEG